jgi:hypothetical protein|tara:strand:+ start:108 stop:434 length:327 start_codon:yes stop_codon:yes gene_type:complete
MYSESLKKEIKSISDVLNSIDVSLQLIANNKTQTTSAFVTKKIIAQRLGVPSISVDKLILQGLKSDGKSGLVEGKHYCKLDPNENNSSKFLYDPYEILKAAWSNFKYD